MYPPELRRFAGATLLPQKLTFHKPRASGGVALKLNLKFKFEFGEEGPQGGASESTAVFLKRTRGGLFLDFAKQRPEKSTEGHATFQWTGPTVVTAKLGLPDLSGLLVGYREVRSRGRPIPTDLRMAARDVDTDADRTRKAATVSFLHKSKTGSTIISYQFCADGGVLRVSKSRENVGQITLSLSEELRFMRYLERALDTLLSLGAH